MTKKPADGPATDEPRRPRAPVPRSVRNSEKGLALQLARLAGIPPRLLMGPDADDDDDAPPGDGAARDDPTR